MDERILNIGGWMHEKELAWLYEMAKSIPEGKVIVEIGAWMGRSSAAIYTGAAGKNPVISIDTWLGSPDEPEHDVAKTQDIFSQYLQNMKELGIEMMQFESFDRLENRPYYLMRDSLDAATIFPDKSIYWIFLDGRHTQTARDIDAYLPKMDDYGIFTGHDYFCFYEHIQQEIHKRFYINEIIHSIWVKHLSLNES